MIVEGGGGSGSSEVVDTDGFSKCTLMDTSN